MKRETFVEILEEVLTECGVDSSHDVKGIAQDAAERLELEDPDWFETDDDELFDERPEDEEEEEEDEEDYDDYIEDTDDEDE
jgi:hypothetical protein